MKKIAPQGKSFFMQLALQFLLWHSQHPLDRDEFERRFSQTERKRTGLDPIVDEFSAVAKSREWLSNFDGEGTPFIIADGMRRGYGWGQNINSDGANGGARRQRPLTEGMQVGMEDGETWANTTQTAINFRTEFLCRTALETRPFMQILHGSPVT